MFKLTASLNQSMPDWAPLVLFGAIVLLLVLLIIYAFLKIFSHLRDLGSDKAKKTDKPAKAPKAKKEKKPKKEKKAKKEKTQKRKGEPDAAPTSATSLTASSGSEEFCALVEQAAGKESSDPEVERITDSFLTEVVDQIADTKGIDLTAKPEKRKLPLIREQKKQASRDRKALSSKAKRLKVPKTVQETIPYYAVYEEDGIIEIRPGVFTRCYILGDVNYQIARDEEQAQMFLNYGQLLNCFEPGTFFEITVNQKNINMEEFERQTMLPMQGDSLDELREERNGMLRRKILEGRNHLVKEKYLTVAIKADSFDAAQATFLRLDTEIDAIIKKIGHASATPMTTVQRLEILHDVYNLGDEGMFGNNMQQRICEDGTVEYVFAEERFRFDIMRRMGLTTKDMVGPKSFHFKGDHGIIGDDTYFRALFIRKIPTFLMDKVLSELTNTEFNMVTSIHYEPIDAEKTQKMIRHKLTSIRAGIADKQRKAGHSNISPDLLVPPDLRDAAIETEELLNDINKKNQKLFFMTVAIVHFADSKKQLDSDTKTIQAIGRRMLLDIKCLSQLQEKGLNTALPLAYNQLAIKRTMTTESAAIFMPFVNQELIEPGGMYYGNNAVSHNLITMDRRKRKNGNGFIFGTPGSGKSMSAKQEMLTVLLSSPDDTVVVIDPEGEYYPMAELLGDDVSEVIRIAVGSDVHINPFDIDMSADGDGEDNPLSMKSDFIVSLCETVVGDKIGLAPAQRSIIDRCVREVYKPYLASFDPETGKYDKHKLPTLKDFYQLLCEQSGYDALQLAEGLEIYCVGTQDVFAHQTNVEYSKRFVVFDIKDVGSTMKSMAQLIVLDNIWNRMVEGRKERRYTWFFVDEIYLLFKNEASAEFLRNVYKRARKYYGLPTGITQNVSDLLENDIARTMISNCEYIQMLNQAPLDRAQLAELLSISPTQLEFVTNSNPGEGLIYDGRVIVPFINKLPKDTKQYMAMTTKPNEVSLREAKKASKTQADGGEEPAAIN